jgi:hypothetical protein
MICGVKEKKGRDIVEGWVRFHRRITQWEWYAEPNVFRVFFHLIIMANHKDNKWRGIEVKRGQLVTSYNKLATQLELSTQQIRTVLDKLESTNEITRTSTNKYTIINVDKYEFYQSREPQSNKQNNTPVTNEQQTNNNQITTNQNDKNEKNANNYVKFFDKIWKLLPIQKYQNKVDFKKFRKLFDSVDEEKILKAIELYKTDMSKRDKKFVSQGSTFLNFEIYDYINQVEAKKNELKKRQGATGKFVYYTDEEIEQFSEDFHKKELEQIKRDRERFNPVPLEAFDGNKRN